MYKYKFIRLNHPGLFAIKPGTWLTFLEGKERFGILINNITKGMVIHDPKNEFVNNENRNYELKSIIEGPRHPGLIVTPQGKNMAIKFTAILEENPDLSRTYAEKPYTELIILINGQDSKTTLNTVKFYLNQLFIRYNSAILNSPILKPDQSYWEESINVSECLFEHEADFETIVRTGFDWNLPYQIVEVFIAISKYGILPPSEEFIYSDTQLPKIPSEYLDIFELFANGIMQFNYFKNMKTAILETFVAVEILVVRITEDFKLRRGISKTKINDFKQAVDLAHRMDIELRLFLDFTDSEKQLLDQMKRARSIRNSIMHNNEPADEKEIKQLITKIQEFLFMIINKYSDYKKNLG